MGDKSTIVKKVVKEFETQAISFISQGFKFHKLEFQVDFFKKLNFCKLKFHVKFRFHKLEFHKSGILLNISQTVGKR